MLHAHPSPNAPAARGVAPAGISHLPTRSRFVRAGAAVLALVALAGAQETAAQEPPPNAAELYRRAFTELHRVLAVEHDRDISLPRVDEASEAAYAEAPWPELLDRTASARSLFEQAAGMQQCRFDDRAGELGDEVRDRLLAMGAMRTLLIADAYKRLATAPEGTLTNCRTMLSFARHLDAQPGTFAASFADTVADEALQLCDAVMARARHDAISRRSIERMLAAIEQRERTRPSLAGLADRAMHDAEAQLSMVTAGSKAGKEALAEASTRSLEMVADLVAPLRTAKPEDVDTLRTAWDRDVRVLKDRCGDKLLRTVLESGTGEALAAALATLVAPDFGRLLAEWRDHGERLAKTGALLRTRLE